MKKKLLAMTLLALVSAAILGAPSALAATVIGDQCTGDDLETNAATFEFSALGNPLPTAAPSSGVVTKWGVDVIPFGHGKFLLEPLKVKFTPAAVVIDAVSSAAVSAPRTCRLRQGDHVLPIGRLRQ